MTTIHLFTDSAFDQVQLREKTAILTSFVPDGGFNLARPRLEEDDTEMGKLWVQVIPCKLRSLSRVDRYDESDLSQLLTKKQQAALKLSADDLAKYAGDADVLWYVTFELEDFRQTES